MNTSMTILHAMGSRLLAGSAVLLLGAGLFGCADRAHLYEKTGIAYKRAFMMQATERDVRPPRGLDAIDANIVMQNYRTMMVQEGKTPGGAGGSGGGGSQGDRPVIPLGPVPGGR